MKRLFAIAVACLIAVPVFSQNKPAAIKLSLALPAKFNYEPLLIASKRGYFAQEGIDLSITTVNGGIESVEALATGSVDLAVSGDAPVAILLARNPSFPIIARYGNGVKMHRLIGDASIKSAADLRGKKIGVQMGSSTSAGLYLWLKKKGLSAKVVTIVPLSPPEMVSAIQSGQVQAVAASDPAPQKILKDKRFHEVADFSGLGSSFPLIITANPKAAQNSEAMKRFLRAVARGAVDIKSNPGTTAKIIAPIVGLDSASTVAWMNHETWGIGWTGKDSAGVAIAAQTLLDAGRIPSMPVIKPAVVTKLTWQK